MIVKMSKVEIIGPRQHLTPVLTLLRDKGDLHIDPATVGSYSETIKEEIPDLLANENTLFEKIFLEKLRDRIRQLFTCLPRFQIRESYLSFKPVIDSVNKSIKKHLESCSSLHQKQNRLEKKLAEMKKHREFLEDIGSRIDALRLTPDLDYIGLNIKNRQGIETLKRHLDCLTDGSCELFTFDARDGGILGLVAVVRDRSATVSRILQDEQFPEYSFPDDCRGMNFIQKADYLRKQIIDFEKEHALVRKQLFDFANRWGPIYRKAIGWIDTRLSIINASGLAFETSMCFIFYGWIPSGKVAGLRELLHDTFDGTVILEEKNIEVDDLDRIPVKLQNPDYFKPFENFTRLLPLPAYSSFDPTPFIALFFPVFFGMIVGDAGYGLLLLLGSTITITRFRAKHLIKDAARIIRVGSLYTIIFGFLYGEVFGDLGHRFLYLRPLLIDRQNNLLPMLYFALSVGLVHVLLGLSLGIINALKNKTRRQALAKAVNLILILLLVVLLVSSFGMFPELLARPIIIIILVLAPILLFSGGLLAPLELLKDIGNIISYARIMAIGLTSVMLAIVANRLSGLTGDVILGLVVGGLLHLFGIVIAVFSSTIHSLRLHYVEFFDKFLDYGGRRYTPLHDEKQLPRDGRERREAS